MPTLVVMNTVRVFEPVNDHSLLLRRTDLRIEPGTEIEAGETEIRCYDHTDKQARPVNWRGKQYFILEEELHPEPDPVPIMDWDQRRRVH